MKMMIKENRKTKRKPFVITSCRVLRLLSDLTRKGYKNAPFIECSPKTGSGENLTNGKVVTPAVRYKLFYTLLHLS
jgi:hypothetical protein